MWDRIEALDMLVRLLIASAGAAVIGWERERQDKPAGLRTHMLVALGSAGFMILTINVCYAMNDISNIRLDPIRVIAGVVGGIGFLGAGAIIQSRGDVHGITTAAGLWVVGAIGVAAGLHEFACAGLITGISFCVLYPLGIIEARTVSKGKKHRTPPPEDD